MNAAAHRQARSRAAPRSRLGVVLRRIVGSLIVLAGSAIFAADIGSPTAHRSDSSSSAVASN